MSALGSGMDVIIELSAEYIERMIRRKLNDIGPGCFAADAVPVEIGGVEVLVEVRNVVAVLDSAWLTESAGLDRVDVYLHVGLRLVYGQVRHELLTQNQWKTLEELGVEDPVKELSIRLLTWPEVRRVLLIMDASALPDWLPVDLLDGLGASFAVPGMIEGRLLAEIPLDFLTQTDTFENEAGEERVLTLLEATPNSAFLRVLAGGHLAIGIDVELSQDEEPMAVGPEGLMPHECGLPVQPYLFQEDIQEFLFEFAESFLDGNDWAIALDAHIVDAMIRGLPSAGMNRAGKEPREGCEQEEAIRYFCLRLIELQDDNIRVRAHGELFYCRDPEPVDYIPNDFYEFCAEVDVSLYLTDSRPRRIRGHRVVTDAELCGDDAGFNCWVDLMEEMPDSVREGDIPLEAIPMHIGDPDSPTGQLTIQDLSVQRNGLILRGAGSVRSGSAHLRAPAAVLFATPCDGGSQPFSRTFVVANDGGGVLNICPLVIRDVKPEDDEDAPFSNPGVFRVVGPRALLMGRGGRALRPTREIEVELELDAAQGQRYVALLDVPNTAGRHTIRLVGDLRPASVRLESDELRLERTDYAPCGQIRPARRISKRFEITNTGPGNLQVCSVEFPVNPMNADGHPAFFAGSDAYPRFLAENETTSIRVIFNPVEADVGQTFEGEMRIITNAGDYDVALVGLLQRGIDERVAGLLGNFGDDVFCGDADWDMIRSTGGRILDVQQVEEFLSVLGGEPCCPPPHGPACLCVDLWEVSFVNVPPGVNLKVVGDLGEAVASNFSCFSSRLLMLPIAEGNKYDLRAEIPPSVAAGKSSRVVMRRWLLQQDGLYTASQHLSDLAVAGDYAYGVGTSDLEVISLTKVEEPHWAASLPGTAGASSVAVQGGYLLVAKQAVKVYSLANPEQPMPIGGLALNAAVRALTTLRIADQPPLLACAAGQGLHMVDLSNPQQPKKISSVNTQVQANRLLCRGNHLYLFGKEGIQAFDLSNPSTPTAVGFLSTQQKVLNALLVGQFALLIHDSTTMSLVDISRPSQLQLAGGWRLEHWVREWVPLAGSLARYKGHFLMLKGDRLGLRVMRLRRGRVDQEKLRKLRD